MLLQGVVEGGSREKTKVQPLQLLSTGWVLNACNGTVKSVTILGSGMVALPATPVGTLFCTALVEVSGLTHKQISSGHFHASKI